MTSLPSRPSGQPSLRAHLVDVEPGRFRYSMWENLSIGVWQDQANRDAAERVLALSQRNARRFPGGHSSVIFILDGAPRPTPEASEMLASLYKEGSSLTCIGVILEGSGFWASSMRSMVLNMQISNDSHLAIRVEDEIEAIVDWLPAPHAERTGVELSPKALRTVLREARAIGTREA